MKTFLCVSLAVASIGIRARGAELNPLVTAWLQGQTNLQTWSAEAIQTRALKSLAQPLTATGHVWFAAPNQFRWELGTPPQTIAVRAPKELLVIYPRLKRVERFPMGEASGQWKEALSLLEAGFPRSQAQLESQYNVLSQSVTNGLFDLVLQPRSASARRMMPQIKIVFGTNDFLLRATELTFADGSTMRNDFKNGVLNPKLDDKLFTPEIPADYKISEPMKGR